MKNIFKKIRRIFSNNLYVLKILFKANPTKVFLSILLSILGCAVVIVNRILMVRSVINEMQAGSDFMKIVFIVLGTFLFNLTVSSLTKSYETYYLPKADAEINRKLQKKFYNKVLALDVECFEQAEFYDRYVRTNADFTAKAQESLKILCDFISIAITLFSTSYILIKIDPFLSVFFLIPFFFEVISGAIFNKLNYRRRCETVAQDRRVDYSNRIFFLLDYVKEMRMTKIYKNILNLYHNANDNLINILIKYRKYDVVNSVSYSLISEIVTYTGSLLYVAFRTLISKTISLGDFFISGGTVGRASSSLFEFANIFNRINENSLYVEDLRAFFDYKPKVSLNEDGITIDKDVKVSLSLKNVSFKYISQEENCIKNINMEIRPGEKIAIVGNNGAGKSTLIKLIMRLYDISEGQILMNGIDIRRYNLNSYRSSFGTVFQDYQVLSLTIAENVLMRECISDEDKNTVETACKHSGIWNKIEELPNGINTILTREFSEEGVLLSGGEFQKIALARVFAKDCGIVILDEPSSALDPIAEYKMYENMMTACKDKSVIFISHRLSSAVLADTVYYLEDGEIKEQGSHKDLIKKGGKYAEMFFKQAEKYKGGDEI